MKIKLFFVFTFVLMTSCGMKTGDAAIELMTPEQVSIIKVLENFSSLTTVDVLIETWGAPTSSGLAGLNPKWELATDGGTILMTAYFLSDGLDKVQLVSNKPMWGYSVYYDDSGVTHSI